MPAEGSVATDGHATGTGLRGSIEESGFHARSHQGRQHVAEERLSRGSIPRMRSWRLFDRLLAEQRLGRPRTEAAMQRGVLCLVDHG